MLSAIPFGLMVSLPFLVPFHSLPIPSFHSEWLAIFLGLAGVLLMVLKRGQVKLEWPCIVTAPLALIAVVALQFSTGMIPYFSNAFIIATYLLWATMLSVAGRTLATAVGERRLTEYLAWFLLAGGLANAVFGVLQYLGLWQGFGGLVVEPMPVALAGVYGNVAQQNHYSTHLALSIVSSSYLGLSTRLSTRRFCLVLLILLGGLMLSGSRTSYLHIGWITFVSWLALRDGAENRAYKTGFRCAIVLLFMSAISVWVVACYLPMIPQVERLLSFSSAIGPRLYLWKHALLMFLHKPLLGVGFDSFAYELLGQLREAKGEKNWGVDQYAHNLVLQLLAVSGVIGLGVVIWPTILFIRRQKQISFSFERMWMLGILGVLFIHSMLEQPLYYAYFLGIAAFVAGVADPLSYVMLHEGKMKAMTAGLLLFSLVFLCKTAADYNSLHGHFFSGRYVNTNDLGQPDLRKNLIRSLHEYSIFSPMSEALAPELFVDADAAPMRKIEFSERIRRYAPLPEVEFRHSALLAEAGLVQEAIEQLERAAKAYPNEAGNYLERFNALAVEDFGTYGRLAAHANDLVTQLGQ